MTDGLSRLDPYPQVQFEEAIVEAEERNGL